MSTQPAASSSYSSSTSGGKKCNTTTIEYDNSEYAFVSFADLSTAGVLFETASIQPSKRFFKCLKKSASISGTNLCNTPKDFTYSKQLVDYPPYDPSNCDGEDDSVFIDINIGSYEYELRPLMDYADAFPVLVEHNEEINFQKSIRAHGQYNPIVKRKGVGQQYGQRHKIQKEDNEEERDERDEKQKYFKKRYSTSKADAYAADEEEEEEE
jgi:hypothetical protein